MLGIFCDQFVKIFSACFLRPFRGPILGPDWPKRDQDGPKRAIKSFRVPRTCICNNLKTLFVFFKFLGSKAVQDSLGRPKKAPKRHLNGSKTSNKKDLEIDQMFTNLLANFGDHFGVEIGSKREPKMGTVLEPACAGFRIPGAAKTENKREG